MQSNENSDGESVRSRFLVYGSCLLANSLTCRWRDGTVAAAVIGGEETLALETVGALPRWKAQSGRSTWGKTKIRTNKKSSNMSRPHRHLGMTTPQALGNGRYARCPELSIEISFRGASHGAGPELNLSRGGPSKLPPADQDCPSSPLSGPASSSAMKISCFVKRFSSCPNEGLLPYTRLEAGSFSLQG